MAEDRDEGFPEPLVEAEAGALTLTDERMRLEALEGISGLRDALVDWDRAAPAISTSEPEDGSFVIECIQPGRRVGFTIEPEEGQSGWFFASFDGSHPVSASGSLVFMEPGELLKKLLDDRLPPAA